MKKIGKCKTEIQIFFYYNYPEDFLTKDDLDWSYGTKKDCKIPVESFGGLGRDFDINTITHFFLDDLAVQVSSLFDKESEEEFSKKLTRINNQEIKEKYLVCRLQRKWDLEEDWKHESNRYAADHIIVKLRCLGFNAKISDPATDNSLSHQKKRWLIDILCRPDKAKTSYSAPDGSPKQLDNSWLIDIGDADPGITAKLSKNLRNLSEAEHRRWCAERLLLGWSPFRSSPEEPRITDDEIKAWFDKNNKQLRVAQKKEKKHIDLVPFDCLPVCAELKVDEKIKDKAIVMAIPDMLEKARGMQKTADR
ncbi:hypothetical protein JCM31598_29750 [Desulfonatronum parangueonense]